MRAELAQKEELLTKTRDKVAFWSNTLHDFETGQARLHLADIV